MNERSIPFVLDSGSQVTLLSRSLFAKHLEGAGMTTANKVPWLTLRAANGLKIPYLGYAPVNCKVGSVHVPGKGVIIVDDECLMMNENRRQMPSATLPRRSEITATAARHHPSTF